MSVHAKHASLRVVVRECIDRLNTYQTDTSISMFDVAIEVITKLTAAGAIKNIHVGNLNLDENQTVEWYAGQILDVLEGQHWFAVNSLINCVDKFAPAMDKRAWRRLKRERLHGPERTVTSSANGIDSLNCGHTVPTPTNEKEPRGKHPVKQRRCGQCKETNHVE